MDITPAEKQEILETFSIERRLERVSELLSHRLEVLRLSRQISDRTKETMDERQREFLLREQLKTIQKELGEGEDAKSQEIAELRQKIDEAGDAARRSRRTRKRSWRGSNACRKQAGEYSMARTYLEWLIELPWAAEDEPPIDIAEARRVLDEDHYGLQQDQAPHPRISRDPQAQPERAQPDPVLCRPARRRQDLARAEHRARDRAQIRPRQPRRHA